MQRVRQATNDERCMQAINYKCKPHAHRDIIFKQLANFYNSHADSTREYAISSILRHSAIPILSRLAFRRVK